MSESQQTQRGQALVILVFALIVLLAILGLAVDGGTFLLEDRRMQNASDAAALAGTHKLAQAICDSTVSDTAIADEIVLYAERNGVADPSNNMVADYVGLEVVEEELSTTVLGRVGAGSIPTGASAISVSTTISRSTYFMTLLGQHTTYPSAGALAVTGVARTGTTLAPIGIPLEVAQGLVPGTITNTFTIDLKHYNDEGEGTIMWGAGTHTAQHRGWMNFGYVWNQTEAPEPFERALDATGSAQALALWMSEGWQGMLYADCFWSDGCHTGDYVPSKPGANSSAICAATDPIIYIPVYDHFLDCDDVPAPRPACPPQGAGGVYHIVGFCGIRITECSQGGGTITAEIVETIIGEGEFSVDEDTAYGGDRACDMHTQIVILWE